MIWQKAWMFDKRWFEEPFPYELFRHRLVELYFNAKKWGVKLHLEYDADTIMGGTEFNFQLMLGPFHFLYSCENYADMDGLLKRPRVKAGTKKKARRKNGKFELD